MPEYLISFNRQWVGDHTEGWFPEACTAGAVVHEMKSAGAYLFAGGLEEEGTAYSADATSGTVLMTDGSYAESKEYLGGFAVVDLADVAPPLLGVSEPAPAVLGQESLRVPMPRQYWSGVSGRITDSEGPP